MWLRKQRDDGGLVLTIVRTNNRTLDRGPVVTHCPDLFSSCLKSLCDLAHSLLKDLRLMETKGALIEMLIELNLCSKNCQMITPFTLK